MANGIGRIGLSTLDLAGKVWALPNTAVGTLVGLAGVPFGAKAKFGNNALQFVKHPWGNPGGITFGNVQIYHDANPEGIYENGPYEYQGPVNLGIHEQGHTYQT